MSFQSSLTGAVDSVLNAKLIHKADKLVSNKTVFNDGLEDKLQKKIFAANNNINRLTNKNTRLLNKNESLSKELSKMREANISLDNKIKSMIIQEDMRKKQFEQLKAQSSIFDDDKGGE